MRPIYKSLALAAMTLQVSLALGAQTYDGTETRETALPVEVLDSLRVELVAPNVSGARDLIKSGECVIDGSDLTITLDTSEWTRGAMYRVQVLATFGTQTQVIYALDVTVPYYVALSDTPQEYEDTVTVVSTIGGAGGGGGADATVYAKDGNGNAHITKPLNINGSVSEGHNTTASGAYSHAEGDNTAAIGDYSHAEGEGAIARGENSHAEGHNTTASGAYSHAEGSDTTASGDYSHAEGNGTVASQENQHVCGQYNVEDTGNDYQFIVGNGADSENRSNAFAVTKSGELALFESDGTPVILTAADLKALIASLQ